MQANQGGVEHISDYQATTLSRIYTKDPKEHNDAEIIQTIDDLSPYIASISDTKSDLGSGGMKSKLQSAAIAQESGIETWIISGSKGEFLLDTIKGNVDYTRILVK